MFPRFGSIVLVVIAVAGLAKAEEEKAAGPSTVSAVCAGGAVVCLDDAGVVSAWNVADGVLDRALAGAMALPVLKKLATDGVTTWGASGSELLRWSVKGRRWDSVARFDAGGEALDGMAVVGERVLLVFPSKVLSPRDGRRYDVPELVGQGRRKMFRTLAVFGGERMLWVGTGYGEWGGHLVGLDPDSGKWVSYYDDLHYVTGIAAGGRGEIDVCWSMSHFGADTLVRSHGEDAAPTRNFPEQDKMYYQRVTRSRFDGRLYAVQDHDLVAIKEGRPERIAELPAPLYVRERMALGVSPGVVALLPTASETVFVVPAAGGPLKVEKGRVTVLQRP